MTLILTNQVSLMQSQKNLRNSHLKRQRELRVKLLVDSQLRLLESTRRVS